MGSLLVPVERRVYCDRLQSILIPTGFTMMFGHGQESVGLAGASAHDAETIRGEATIKLEYSAAPLVGRRSSQGECHTHAAVLPGVSSHFVRKRKAYSANAPALSAGAGATYTLVVKVDSLSPVVLPRSLHS